MEKCADSLDSTWYLITLNRTSSSTRANSVEKHSVKSLMLLLLAMHEYKSGWPADKPDQSWSNCCCLRAILIWINPQEWSHPFGLWIYRSLCFHLAPPPSFVICRSFGGWKEVGLVIFDECANCVQGGFLNKCPWPILRFIPVVLLPLFCLCGGLNLVWLTNGYSVVRNVDFLGYCRAELSLKPCSSCGLLSI